jgi:hypothetical protein
MTFRAGAPSGVKTGITQSMVVASDRTLNVNTTTVGNVGTGEDDLRTYSVPAATLAVDGDHLAFEAAGTFAATANNKRIKVKFGATTIFDTGVLAITAAGDWYVSGLIIRTGAATQKCVAHWTCTDAALPVKPDYTTAAETLSGAVTLKLTGEATANNDVVQELLIVRLLPAP